MRRNAGPARGKDLYQAIAQVTDVRDYNYRLQWLTQGPAITRDLPNTETEKFWPHQHLAHLPDGISITSITAALLLQKQNAQENSSSLDPHVLLARRQGVLF